jgi:hypothetical protein
MIDRTLITADPKEKVRLGLSSWYNSGCNNPFFHELFTSHQLNYVYLLLSYGRTSALPQLFESRIVLVVL